MKGLVFERVDHSQRGSDGSCVSDCRGWVQNSSHTELIQNSLQPPEVGMIIFPHFIVEETGSERFRGLASFLRPHSWNSDLSPGRLRLTLECPCFQTTASLFLFLGKRFVKTL
jgi:hypothetical protein